MGLRQLSRLARSRNLLEAATVQMPIGQMPNDYLTIQYATFCFHVTRQVLI